MSYIDASPGVVIGLDLTNIYLGRRQAAFRHRESPDAVRLLARELYRLAANGRPVYRAIALMNERTSVLVRKWFAEFFELVPVAVHPLTGKEIAGDEMLQNRIMLALDLAPSPGTLVLLTGDGAGFGQQIGFATLLLPARHRSWGIEVISWADTTNPRLAALASEVGFHEALDDWYYGVTFVEGGRRAQRVPTGYRPVQSPHPWTSAEAARVQALVATWKAEAHEPQRVA